MKNKKALFRAGWVGGLILLTFVLPWYLLLILGVATILYFGWYEAILVGGMMDVLYGSGSVFGVATGFLFTALFFLAILMRPVIRRYFFTSFT